MKLFVFGGYDVKDNKKTKLMSKMLHRLGSVKIMTSLLLIVALAFSLTACSQDKAGAPDANKKSEPEEMSIVLDWYPNAIHAFLYNAIEKGYFADEGIELKILFPANPNDGISMPAAGKADFGIYYMSDMIKARGDENVPIKSVGAIVQDTLNIVLSIDDKNIKRPKDFEGKTIGYSGMVLSMSMIEEMMRHDGADPSKVKFIDVGFDLLNSMTTGQVDATIGCMKNHEIPVLEKEGFKVDVMELYDYGIPNSYEMLILASDKTLETRKEKVDGFLRAIKKGFADMKNDKKGSLDILFKHQNAENFPLDRSVEEKSYDMLLSSMEKSGIKFLEQDAKMWQDYIDWMKKLGFLENDLKADDLIYKAN